MLSLFTISGLCASLKCIEIVSKTQQCEKSMGIKVKAVGKRQRKSINTCGL